jgi:hypothetical protein
MNNDIPPATGNSSTVPQSTLAGRLTNIFVTPGEVFAGVRSAPLCHQNWLVPALIFLLASWCAGALIFSQPAIKQQMADMQEQALQKQFQKQIDAGKMTQAQADQIKAGATKFSGIAQTIGMIVGPVFGAGLALFGGGFLLWAGGNYIFKRPFDFMKGVEIAGLALAVSAMGALVKGLLAAGTGNMFAGPGLALLVMKHYDPANLAHGALAALDGFALWALAVKSIGLAKLCDVSPAKAAAWVFGVWIALTGGLLTFGWLAQKLASGLHGG